MKRILLTFFLITVLCSAAVVPASAFEGSSHRFLLAEAGDEETAEDAPTDERPGSDTKAPESNVPTTLNPYTGTLAKPEGGTEIFDSSLYSWRGITGILLPRVANWITSLLAGLAVLFLIITGVQYLLSGAEEDKLTKAHKSLIYILGALVLILFAYTLVYLTLSLLAP